MPDPIEVPANVRVTFRLTSPDVIHGFQVVGTNANAMAIPGYVTQFTVTFAGPGNTPIACNEYCGLMHHAWSANSSSSEEAREEPAHTRAHSHRRRRGGLRRRVRHGRAAGAVDRGRRFPAAQRIPLLHLGHGARRPDGARLHDLFHHGPRLRVRQESLGRINGRGVGWAGFWIAADRLGHGRGDDPARTEHRALHLLSADAGAPALLHRRDAARRRDRGCGAA